MADIILPISNGALALDEAGEGPPIILLHGFSFSRAMWAPQIEALVAGHRVVRYDLRGFGQSTRPRAPYAHADDLAVLIAALDLSAPLLVGLSLGANIALEFAVRHPGVARGLVLASPGLADHIWSGERPVEVAARIARERGLEAAKTYWMGHPIYASLRRAGADGLLRDMVDRYDAWHWCNPDPRETLPGISALLSGMRTPTLVLSGGTDAADYRAIADRLVRDLPAAALDRFEDAGHLLNLECPERFNATLLAFDASVRKD
ncbi:alpha/beta fold hydrolase [Sphingomonas sp. CGMCC 1.13654]|uniref:Alpha/beta fold hydrolase n=1 Tax=Sphingomonas chungangi TaxID=2683589 RepID=A0A838L5L3_9SPHN|nr:alpha/beta fold hydrolase [Sphingomonas chungangi]MBA2933975.1 alpha/beta fold hydrolase [Sphingomonas chungangi]MVW57100.1 alpha/beta fold hydrolase [Sphingomonas chungangi]